MHPAPFAPGSCRVRKTVGIDLGTTNSVISLLDPVDSALITGQDERGHRTFPSLVGYHPQQEKPVVGWAALELPNSSPQRSLPLASVKRYMGTNHRFQVGSRLLTPVDASARILVHLREVMAATLTRTPFLPGHPLLLDSAIITMPAYFNHAQIEATRQAGEQAGFEVVELIHEPTAAAIYYSWLHKHGNATYLVYDLGGGTFDVSIIRRRLDDYEVLAVSGDPFLGGDDFDRLLASFLIERGRWTWQRESSATPAKSAELDTLFEPTTPAGAAAFARLVRLAEGIKCSLTEQEQVSLFNPHVLTTPDNRSLGLECPVSRSNLVKLLASKVQRTIECCQEALARARERVGLRLEDIDHVILVGGSSRMPLVRDTVQAAFCNPDRAEHVRSPHLLLHEPDLCVAYGAALRAATQGTHYLFSLPGPNAQASPKRERGVQLDLHLTSPPAVKDIAYLATGMVRCRDEEGQPLPAPFLEGGSVRIRSLATGLTEEAFLDDRGTFAQALELVADTDNPFEWVVCDHDGRERARVLAPIRHQSQAHPLGPSVLPTQLITRPLQIEVLTRGRQRVKQVIAPLGAPLPGVFSCICRTTDQSGRVVMPIFEENRIIKQLVIENLSPRLPVGSPVEVEFRIDVRHTIEVSVRVRQGAGQSDRCEQVTLSPPPPPGRPTREEVEQVLQEIEELSTRFTGAFRSRVKTRATQLSEDLLEALGYDDEPRAIQRMAELRDLVQQLEANRDQALDPPWARFMQLVHHCRDLAGEVARTTGRPLAELLEHVQAQERYAEQAWEEHNANLYRECQDNLQKYAGYLQQLLADALPRPASTPSRPPEDEARDEVERFRAFLSRIWKQVREKQRNDLEPRLVEIANQARGLSQKIKSDALAVLRETRRLGTEIEKIATQIDGTARPGPDEGGLLEGSL